MRGYNPTNVIMANTAKQLGKCLNSNNITDYEEFQAGLDAGEENVTNVVIFTAHLNVPLRKAARPPGTRAQSARAHVSRPSRLLLVLDRLIRAAQLPKLSQDHVSLRLLKSVHRHECR